MKEKMIASRIAIHKHTAEMVALRLPYEEMVSSRLCLLNFIEHFFNFFYVLD